MYTGFTLNSQIKEDRSPNISDDDHAKKHMAKSLLCGTQDVYDISGNMAISHDRH